MGGGQGEEEGIVSWEWQVGAYEQLHLCEQRACAAHEGSFASEHKLSLLTRGELHIHAFAHCLHGLDPNRPWPSNGPQPMGWGVL